MARCRVKWLETFVTLPWLGKPNGLSQRHVEWPMIDQVTAATKKPPTDQPYRTSGWTAPPLAIGAAPVSLREIIYQRRSAVALDGRTSITRDAFYQILAKTLVGLGQFPFNALPWTPLIHLALFVHRVQNLDPGLYVLVRDPAQTPALRAEMKPEFDWVKPLACPDGLELYRLQTGDVRKLSEQVSCHQSIAADGCFSLGMIAEFERPVRQYGGLGSIRGCFGKVVSSARSYILKPRRSAFAGPALAVFSMIRCILCWD